MKLSEIKGERALTVIADVLPPIFRISADPKVTKLLEKRKPKKGQTSEQAGIEWLADAVGPLLKDHKNEFIDILSAIEGVDRETYLESLDLIKLINDVADLFTDPMFRTLFFSKTQTSGDSSGSASENTEDPTEQ